MDGRFESPGELRNCRVSNLKGNSLISDENRFLKVSILNHFGQERFSDSALARGIATRLDSPFSTRKTLYLKWFSAKGASPTQRTPVEFS